MDFHTPGSQQKEQKTKTWNGIGQSLVPGALNDTKKIRKASADIFANVGHEMPEEYLNNATSCNTNPNESQNSADSG